MNTRTRSDLLLLIACCAFLFFYGLGSFGLLGADEPRYAQVAREMLDRRDWVTPTLQGVPWLEKPPLYYWQAMIAYRVGRAFPSTSLRAGVPATTNDATDRMRAEMPPPHDGVTDQLARLPSAVDAALLIIAVYIFLRRYHPGSEVDGALIVASAVGMIGFARAASPDMPLAATLAIALLGWYTWYQGRSRLPLAAFYIFLALATLAKGPVAPFLAAAILLIFASVKRDWRAILGTLWVPGILIYFAVALPWYVAVQLRNPQFFRVFILQHNLGRFAEDLYHHRQPFWFYLPVLLLAIMPWTLWLILAVMEKVRLAWSERREAFSSAEDSWGLFLLIWLLVTVLFFSASQSKLPGYILPAIPAGGLLVCEYLAVRRSQEAGLSSLLSAAHGIFCGALVFAALVSPTAITNQHLAMETATYIAAGVAALVALAIGVALRSKAGLRLLRVTTLAATVVGMAAVLRLAAPSIDAKLSARPIARAIQAFSHEPVPLAVYQANREQEYGLEFYLNRPVQRYEFGQLPVEAHLLVTSRNALAGFMPRLPGRKVSYLTHIPAQNLDVYYVASSVPSTQ
jgi:4-amino-4-deoxy-L-arabinose transferase-like glycosyltransferase